MIKFNNLSPTPLETAESVDTLRIVEHSFEVKMVLTKYETYSVDTIEDMKSVEDIMRKDRLINKYVGKR